MKLIQRLGSMGLVLVLLLILLPMGALAVDNYSYKPIAGYPETTGFTVETYSQYPWIYDTSKEVLTSGNSAEDTLAQLKITIAKDGYLKFDYAMSAADTWDVLSWRVDNEYQNYEDVYFSDGSVEGSFDFKTGSIAVKAEQVVYIAYAKSFITDETSCGYLKNLRLVTNGTITVSSSDTTLGMVSTSQNMLSNLQAGTEVTLTATEMTGMFEGWYETVGNITKRLSSDKVYTYTVNGDAAIEGRFIKVASNAVATVNGAEYDSLSEALAGAQKTATAETPVTVKLIQDVTVTENLTIPTYVTLLLPYETKDQGKEPVYEYFLPDTNRQKGNVYRKLTVANGVNVTVNGTLLVNAWLGSSDTRHQGSIGSDYGLMELNGALTVNSGGALKVRGLLTGSGSITAKSGGEVWQAFEMTDWPGGTVATQMNGRNEFPISQYYFQRIQVPTTLEYGSSMSVYAYLFVPSEGNSVQLPMKGLIGTSDSAFFKMMDEGSSLTLGYVADTYTSTFEIRGNVEIRSFNISMGSNTISTAGRVCPLPASFSMTLKDGANLTVTESMKMMPGAKLFIEQGGTVNIQEGTEFFLYGPNDYMEPRAVPSSSDVAAPITPEAGATIFNYGTLNINGTLHTSAGDENQLVDQGQTNVSGSGSISQGTVGKTLLSYNANGGIGSIASHYLEAGQPATLAANSFTRPGFKFLGWSSDPDFPKDPFLGTETLITYQDVEEVPALSLAKLTLYAVWEEEPVAASDYAVWKVGSTLYGYATDEASYLTEFDKAMSAALSSGNVVILANNGTLPKGDYTIPSGVKVLIPYSSSSSFDVNPVGVLPSTAYQTPTNPYRVLTMAPGAKLTVNGALNVGSRMYSGGAGSIYSGAPTGTSARINMQGDSTITVKGTLYAYGFITGSGSVTAESGSAIHEMFQLTEQRGGSNLQHLTRDKFPVTQYYVQNIEVPLTYMYGCTETLHTNMYVMDVQNPINNIAFLGSGSGLFQMKSGSTVVRTYDPDTDRMIWDVYGNISFASTTLVTEYATIDTTLYPLPLTNNFTINIHEGTTTLLYKMELLPGVQVTVDKDATLQINKNFWVYDRDSWVGKQFVYVSNYSGCDLIPVPYSPARRYNRTSADLTDATINVNGALRISESMYTTISDGDDVLRDEAAKKGMLYTATSGANIYTSEGTGTVYLGSSISDWIPNAMKIVRGSTAVSVPAISVLLHNVDASGKVTAADGTEYTHTQDYPAGTTFSWCAEHGRWESGTVTVTYNANGGSGSASEQLHTPGKLAAQLNNFSREGLHLKGWNTKADGSGTFIEDGGLMALYQNTTLYAQWEGKVTWIGGDGKEIRTDTVDYNTVPNYGEENLPTKETDAQYVYTFAGWSASADGEVLSTLPAVTKDTTYYAVFSGELRSYAVTWKNWDGTVLATQENVSYGVTPVYSGAVPTREGETTAEYSLGYVFDGWDPEVASVKGDVTYTAVLREEKNYIVQFYNADGTTLLEKVGVPAGTVPTYKEPAAPSGGYSFAGWATTPNGEALAELPVCNKAVKYYAVFVKTGSGLEGDINGDRTVDIIDLNKLLANYNKSGADLEGDINGDKTVDIIDLNKLLANYNKSLS